MAVLWSIQLLGRLRLRQGERSISRFRTLKAAGLLAYLAYHRRSHSREALIELFWPEAELPSARHSLSLALSSLRHQLEPPGIPAGSVIVADRASVELNPDAFTTDVMEFERHLRMAAQAPDDGRKSVHLARALEAYGGSLLPGVYEDWVFQEQDRLFQRYLQAVRQQVALLSRAGEHPRALELARQAVAVDPLHEELHVEVMRLLSQMEQPDLALLQYRELERVLAQELDAQPSPEVQRLARQLEEQRLRSGVPLEAPRAPVRDRFPAHPSLPPAGTVSFLLTDIEGSTARWEREGERFRTALGLHHALLRRQFQRHGGHEVQEAGDSFLVAFPSAGDALACAVAIQRALGAQAWPTECAPVRVRMALHSGDVELEDGDYRGLTLHRASRLLAAAHGGQILSSEATSALLRRDLEPETRLRELGSYRLRDVDAPEHLFQVEYPGMPAEGFPPPRAERSHRGNLPPQVTRFFGRERELTRLQELLAPPLPGAADRLFTLTGPGGTGKTRLALEAAARLQETYRGAVWLVSLADLTDSRLLPEWILAALGARPEGERSPLDQIAGILGEQPALLVLDNLEQLLDEPGEALQTVRRLLERSPRLQMLATSRQLLGLPGEREFPVSPLPTPDGAGALEVLSLYESVRLFVDRAQAVRPDFQVTNANAAALAELCNRLEGIPLALELAAARAQVLSPAQMLQQLAGGGRFELLSTRKRGVAERQRALRTTIDWSYHLLSDALQRFFRRLSVFRGGWSVEAAEAVCDEPLALDHLAQLRECSLVGTEEGPDGIRFRMLETLREYAALRLEEGGETAETLARHHNFFLSLAETAAPELRGEDQAAWLVRLEADHDNFRVLLAHQGDPETRGETEGERRLQAEKLLRLVNALWYFWSIRGHLTEGRRTLAEVLAMAPEERSIHRARALTAAGALAHDQSDYPAARVLLEESVARWRELSAVRGAETECGLAYALNCLANVGLDDGREEESLALYQEALGLYRQAGDARGAAMALSNLGVLHLERGETGRAADLLTESIRLKRGLGNPYGLAMSLESLGNLERSRGNRELALELCREALELRRGLGHRLGVAMSLNNLGHLLLETGDPVAARERLLESLDLFLELDEPRSLIECLTGLAGTMAAQGRHEEAVRLLAAMDAQREASGFEPRPCEKGVLKRWREDIRGALDDRVLEALTRSGSVLSLEQAVDLARKCGSFGPV